MWTRVAAAIYLAIVFLLWLSQRFVVHQGLWIPGAAVTVFAYAGRQLALRKYAPPQDRTEKRPVWLVLACSVAGICSLRRPPAGRDRRMTVLQEARN